MKLHPDLGGSTKEMQKLNFQYQKALKAGNLFYQKHESKNESVKFPEIIEQVIFLPFINIEIVGDWIWITGNTKPVKDEIKKAGFWFSKDKTAWYYRPAEYSFKRYKNAPKNSLDEIRNKYGSETIENKTKSNFLK